MPAEHYCVPPLQRVDLKEVLTLIRRKKYFVLHAPRQSGKTSTLLALAERLNSMGGVRCVYVNLEVAQTAREDVPRAMRAILGQFGERARTMLQDGFINQVMADLLDKYGPDNALNVALGRWAESSPGPLVLLIDEVDSLVGDSLISLLRQLRAGYDLRPSGFPQSVVLCGVRDVRNYRVYSREDRPAIARGSAFNIKAKSLRLANFTESEVQVLINQHQAQTGQRFEEGMAGRIMEMTGGQPWLVNALAYQACFEDPGGLDRSVPIRVASLAGAKDALIGNRPTHFDQLANKLRESRVRRVVEPLLAGTERHQFTSRDLEYVRDLGLVAPTAPVQISSPIYREAVSRELTYSFRDDLEEDAARYIDAVGRLDVSALMERFQEFCRQNSDHWAQRFGYYEAGPQLNLQSFLGHIVEGIGTVERESGLGRGRTDLLVRWPHEGRRELRYLIECKILREGRRMEVVIAQGVHHTAEYMEQYAAESGHLVVFDLREGRTWSQRLFRRQEFCRGIEITVWGM